MRNRERIKPYCDMLATMWQTVPDLRFTQFMDTMMKAWEVRRGSSAFYAEDDEFLCFMFKYLNEITEST